MKSKVCILLISLFLATGSIWAQSGDLGDGLTWKYEGTTLTISKNGDGSGVIPNLIHQLDAITYQDNRPWNNIKDVITKIVIGEGVTKIGNEAFLDCSNVSNLSLPSTLTSIGKNAFSNCIKLEILNLPSSLKNIGEYSFSSCISLTSISLPKGIETISVGAFSFCTSLSSLPVFPESIDSIGGGVFYGCGFSGVLIIPEGIKAIGEYTFGSCEEITSIVFPSTLTTIGSNAFLACKSLNSGTLIIPENIESIGYMAFALCNGISIIMKSPIPPILGDDAFSFSTSSVIYVPSASVDVYKNAPNWSYYEYCIKANDIVMEGDLGDGLSWKIENLTLTISKTGEGSGKMPNIIFDMNQPWDIYRNLITKVVISKGVKHIGALSFYRCYSLANVTIAEDLETIGYMVFMYCNNLVAIDVDGNNNNFKSNNEVLFTKDGKNLIIYPSGKKGSYSIPLGVETINNQAFYFCLRLTKVTIPETVVEIGDQAFGGCDHIDTIISNNIIPPAALVSSFYLLESLKAIHVPIGSGNAYKAAPGWSQYAHLIQADATGLEYINKQTLLAYPNPTSSQVTISGIAPGTVLRIYTFSGALLGKYTSTDERITIDISNLAKGIYLIKTDDGFCKIIKN